MKGQLWQPCPVCDAEPVCVDCERCRRHCTCARQTAERELYRQINREHPGFLESLVKHHEEGASER